MKRRKFIQLTAASAPMISLFPAKLDAIIRDTSGPAEKRVLGKTGVKLSILGLGGVVLMDTTAEQSATYVKMAIDKGINYFDVAPMYGNAEIMMGPALEPYRKDVFLACKTTERQKEGARMELKRSLERLRTDYFDLYQFHAVTTVADVETIFSDGGAIETFLEAREEGKIRYIGFSAHSVEAAMALMDNFDFDTILFPTNYTTWHAGNFGPQVLQRAQDNGMGILALKAMAKGPYAEGTEKKTPKCWYEPLAEPDEALQGLRFTLSHPVTAAIPPGNEQLFTMALDLIPKITPLAEEEIEEIKKKGLAGKPLFQYPMQA